MTKGENQKYMTVIEERPDGTSAIACINLHDVDFIESENRRLVYYIGNKRYYQITKLQEIDLILNEKDGFVSLDRTNLVNLRNVKHYDEDLGKVYFEEESKMSRYFATIARIKQKVMSPLIKRAIAKNLDLQITKKFTSEKKQKVYRHQENQQKGV